MSIKHDISHAAVPVAYRIQWANGEVDFLTYIPKGESGVYACEPLYTHPPEPARDAKDGRWRQMFTSERAWRYREQGMKIEAARIHAETDATRAAIAVAQESGDAT